MNTWESYFRKLFADIKNTGEQYKIDCCLYALRITENRKSAGLHGITVEVLNLFNKSNKLLNDGYRTGEVPVERLRSSSVRFQKSKSQKNATITI